MFKPVIVNVPVVTVLMVPVVIVEAVKIPLTYKLTVEPALAVPDTALVATVNAVGLIITGAIKAVLLPNAEPPLPDWQVITGSDWHPLASVYQTRYEPEVMFEPPVHPEEYIQDILGVTPVSGSKMAPVFVTLLSVVLRVALATQTVHPVDLLVPVIPFAMAGPQERSGVTGRLDGEAQLVTLKVLLTRQRLSPAACAFAVIKSPVATVNPETVQVPPDVTEVEPAAVVLPLI
jgi:hypothetical protein